MSKYFKVRNSCPVCNSSKVNEIYSNSYLSSPIKEFLERFYSWQGKIEFEYLINATYVLEECYDCGLIYQKEVPDGFLTNKLYEEWIDPKKNFELNFSKDKLFLYSWYAQEVMMILAFLNAVSFDLTFLDFGMGWGGWCGMARAFGCKCYGSELSKSKIKFAISQGLKVITYDEISEYKFDFINAEQVFEHIPDPLETLCRLKKSLKSSGIIKISVPDGGGIKRRLKYGDWMAPIGSGKSLNSISPLEHINCFNRCSLIKLANLAELQIVRMPILLQLGYATNWITPKNIIRNFIYPIYRNILSKGTYLFFRKRYR